MCQDKKTCIIFDYEKMTKMPNFLIWAYGNLIKYANLFLIDSTSFKHPWWNVKISQIDCCWRPNNKILSTVGFSNINNLTIQMVALWLPWQPELWFLFFDIYYIYALKWHDNTSFMAIISVSGKENVYVITKKGVNFHIWHHIAKWPYMVSPSSCIPWKDIFTLNIFHCLNQEKNLNPSHRGVLFVQNKV